MKRKFKRFVYLVLSLMLLVTSVLVAPQTVSAAAAVPLSSLAPGNTVKFGGQTWKVLDPNTGYLLMQGFYGESRAFDPDNTNTFNPTDSNNIAYYLNNTFYTSLYSADRPLIQSHSWTTGNHTNESSSNTTCKVGLISYSEWNSYKSFLGDPSLSFCFRTPYTNSYAIWFMNNNGTVESYYANYTYAVRPALFLSPNILVSGGNGGTVLGGRYHTVSVSAVPSADGTVSGGGVYAEGNSVTVTATPYSGYSFVNWTEGGTQVSTAAAYTFTMGTSDRTLVANFREEQIIPAITVVNGVPFSITIYNTRGTLNGTNNTYGLLASSATGNDNVISGTLTGVPGTLTDISLGNGKIKIKAVNPPATTLNNASFY